MIASCSFWTWCLVIGQICISGDRELVVKVAAGLNVAHLAWRHWVISNISSDWRHTRTVTGLVAESHTNYRPQVNSCERSVNTVWTQYEQSLNTIWTQYKYSLNTVWTQWGSISSRNTKVELYQILRGQVQVQVLSLQVWVQVQVPKS